MTKAIIRPAKYVQEEIGTPDPGFLSSLSTLIGHPRY